VHLISERLCLQLSKQAWGIMYVGSCQGMRARLGNAKWGGGATFIAGDRPWFNFFVGAEYSCEESFIWICWVIVFII